MDDSDSSGLSEHSDHEVQMLAPVFIKARAATKLKFPPPNWTPKPKRPPSPPHEEVLADNPDIAVRYHAKWRAANALKHVQSTALTPHPAQFIVMFRSRFNEVMPTKLPNFGPQDIERGVVDSSPTPELSSLLCALLALVLNRKKHIEYAFTHVPLYRSYIDDRVNTHVNLCRDTG